MTYYPQREPFGSDGGVIVYGIIRDLQRDAHGLGVDAGQELRYSIDKEAVIKLR